MMRVSSLLLLAASLAAVPGLAPAAVQQAPPQASTDQDEEITVTGQRRSLTSTMKTVLIESDSDQMGRFEERVCPGVAGLPANFAATLVGLIRSNAQQAGMKLQPEGCRPNSIAVFTTSPNAFIKGLYEKDKELFGYIRPRQKEILMERPAPIISWRVHQQKSRDGVAIGGGSVDGVGTPDTGVVRNAAATRLYKNVRHDIILSMAAVDLKAAHGKTVQQLADVATLHLFLDVSHRATAEAPAGSMLSLFTPRPKGMPAPARLSQMDWGMLKGLYGIKDNNISSFQQRERMARQTRREDEGKD